jgi:hypothetical protein
MRVFLPLPWYSDDLLLKDFGFVGYYVRYQGDALKEGL